MVENLVWPEFKCTDKSQRNIFPPGEIYFNIFQFRFNKIIRYKEGTKIEFLSQENIMENPVSQRDTDSAS